MMIDYPRNKPLLLLKKQTSNLSKQDFKFLRIFRDRKGYEYCYNTYKDEHYLYKTAFPECDKDYEILKVWFNYERRH